MYFPLVLLTLMVPLQIGKCTCRGTLQYMYPRLGAPALEHFLMLIFNLFSGFGMV